MGRESRSSARPPRRLRYCAAVTGGDWATGAILGGAAGAATGALTDSDDIDLNGNNRKKRRRW